MKKPVLAPLLVVLVGGLGFGAWLLLPGGDENAPWHRIEHDLYLGSWVAQPPLGTRAAVNVCGREDSYKVEAQLWDPVLEDGKEPPTLDWLRRTVDFIVAQRRAKRPVYVHCMAGINRSATVVTAVLMQDHGWSCDQALTFVRGKRPVVQPDPEMLKLLNEWERSCPPRK